MNALESTIVAQATPIGIGAIAIIRLSGTDAKQITESIMGNRSIEKQVFVSWLYDEASKKIDQALVLYFAAPNSFTGEDVVEFHTHGNQLIVEKLIKTCLYYGAELAEPGEFSQRAFLNDKLSLSSAESIADLIHSKSEQLLDASINQYSGAFQGAVSDIEELLLQTLAYVQGQLDFPMDTIDQGVDMGHINQSIEMVRTKLKALIDSAKTSSFLREGLDTVILGRPNVGKSSILNYILQRDRAIVSDQPGTTRDYLEQSVILGDVPLNLIDTAGIHDTDNQIEATGIQKAKELAQKAELILFVMDNQPDCFDEDIQLMQTLQTNNPQSHFIIILNKQDLLGESEKTQLISKLDTLQTKYILFSAKEQYGLSQLTDEVRNFIQVDNLQGDFNFSINQRQSLCFQMAFDSLVQSNNDNLELLSSSIEESLYHLNQISGGTRFDPEGTLDSVFEHFCIGK